MRPFHHKKAHSFGSITYRWKLTSFGQRWQKHQNRRDTGAHWPSALYSRFTYDEEDHGYEPYPEPDTDTYIVLFWRRRPHRLPHVADRKTFRYTWAEPYTLKHLRLIRRARRFRARQFSRWPRHALQRHRGY